MRYIAVFDIPDDYGFGCPTVKACPNDGKVRCDADPDTMGVVAAVSIIFIGILTTVLLILTMPI